MNFVKATVKDTQLIYDIVSRTIQETYTKCYNEDVVNFFLKIHSIENIERDILNHSVYIIMSDSKAVGTGCAKNKEITRVYILPEYHGKGLGIGIMDLLESEIANKFDKVSLSPSAIAVNFYERRGYRITEHSEHKFDDFILNHDIMEKKLR